MNGGRNETSCVTTPDYVSIGGPTHPSSREVENSINCPLVRLRVEPASAMPQ